MPPEPERGLSSRDGVVYHFVAIWLEEGADAAQRAAIVEATRGFTDIPGVLFAEAGRAIPDERPVVVSDYDVGVLIAFNNAHALRAYQTHPLHQAAVREVLGPAAAKIRVYDFGVAHAE